MQRTSRAHAWALARRTDRTDHVTAARAGTQSPRSSTRTGVTLFDGGVGAVAAALHRGEHALLLVLQRALHNLPQARECRGVDCELINLAAQGIQAHMPLQGAVADCVVCQPEVIQMPQRSASPQCSTDHWTKPH